MSKAGQLPTNQVSSIYFGYKQLLNMLAPVRWVLFILRKLVSAEINIVSVETLILGGDYLTEKYQPALRIRSDLFAPAVDNSLECLTMYDELSEKSFVTLYADFGPNTLAEFFQ